MKRETVITREIAAIERKLQETSNKTLQNALKTKKERLEMELKGMSMSTQELAKKLLGNQRTQIKAMSKVDFNDLIRRLSKKPEYAFLKTYSRDEIINDQARPAKPKGWRFKGRGNYKVPTPEQIARGKRSGKVYFERRNKRSDVSRAAQLKHGGPISKTETGAAHLYVVLKDGNIRVYHGDGVTLTDNPEILVSKNTVSQGTWDMIWNTLKKIKSVDEKNQSESGSASIYITLSNSNLKVYHGSSVKVNRNRLKLLHEIDNAQKGSWANLFETLRSVKEMKHGGPIGKDDRFKKIGLFVVSSNLRGDLTRWVKGEVVIASEDKKEKAIFIQSANPNEEAYDHISDGDFSSRFVPFNGEIHTKQAAQLKKWGVSTEHKMKHGGNVYDHLNGHTFKIKGELHRIKRVEKIDGKEMVVTTENKKFSLQYLKDRSLISVDKPRQERKPMSNEERQRKNADKIKDLERERKQLLMDMEQEAEPEGGPIANRYGRELEKLDKRIHELKYGKSTTQMKTGGEVEEKVVFNLDTYVLRYKGVDNKADSWVEYKGTVMYRLGYSFNGKNFKTVKALKEYYKEYVDKLSLKTGGSVGSKKIKWKPSRNEKVEGYVSKSFPHGAKGDMLLSKPELIKKWSERIESWIGVKPKLNDVKEFFTDFRLDFNFEGSDGNMYRIYSSGENAKSKEYHIQKYKSDKMNLGGGVGSKIKPFSEVKVGDKGTDYNGVEYEVIALADSGYNVREKLEKYDKWGAIDAMQDVYDTDEYLSNNYVAVKDLEFTKGETLIYVYGEEGFTVPQDDDSHSERIDEKRFVAIEEAIKDICENYAVQAEDTNNMHISEIEIYSDYDRTDPMFIEIMDYMNNQTDLVYEFNSEGDDVTSLSFKEKNIENSTEFNYFLAAPDDVTVAIAIDRQTKKPASIISYGKIDDKRAVNNIFTSIAMNGVNGKYFNSPADIKANYDFVIINSMNDYNNFMSKQSAITVDKVQMIWDNATESEKFLLSKYSSLILPESDVEKIANDVADHYKLSRSEAIRLLAIAKTYEPKK